jgi:D-alanyl-D-alanine dipeptidase
MILSHRIFLLHILLLGVWSCQTEKADQSKKIESVLSKKDSVVIIEQLIISEVEQRMIEQGLVDIQSLDSTIMVDLKYSTTDNFVKTDVYGDLTRAYMQVKPAQMLVKANKILKEKYPNYRLLVYDAARPLNVQHTLWNLLDSIPPIKREDFVPHLSKNSQLEKLLIYEDQQLQRCLKCILPSTMPFIKFDENCIRLCFVAKTLS